MDWILICKFCKFGEYICQISRDIKFSLGVYFFGAPCIKHPVQDRVKPSFAIFDIRTLTLSHLQGMKFIAFDRHHYRILHYHAEFCAKSENTQPSYDQIRSYPIVSLTTTPQYWLSDLREILYDDHNDGPTSKISNIKNSRCWTDLHRNITDLYYNLSDARGEGYRLNPAGWYTCLDVADKQRPRLKRESVKLDRQRPL